MANKPTPAQRRVIETLDRPLFVSAGAGSGKSSTLAERVAWALMPGSGEGGRPYLDGIDQVLIITFTHAAADEIKDKVRARLRSAGLAEQALAVDGAWISTIHGMCSRIIRRHALELGVDPQFRMGGETELDEMRRAAEELVSRAIDEQLLFPDLTSEVPLHAHGHDAYSVMDMAGQLVDAAGNASHGLDSIVFPGEDVSPTQMLASYRELLGTWLARVGSDRRLMAGKSASADYERLSADAARIDEVLCGQPLDDSVIEDVAKGLAAPKRNYGGNEVKELSGEVRDAARRLTSSLAIESFAERGEDLMGVARMVESAYGQLKREAGVLDSDDLLRLALSALRDHPAIASLYVDRFKLVMVDEFQDTNAQQVELVGLLSGKDACHLATVGDAQQSIYRFRAADVEVFRDREAGMGAESLRKLDMNFRSHADILAFVSAALGHGALDGFMPLAPCETRADSYKARSMPRCAVELVVARKQGRKAPSAEVRRQVLAWRLARRLAAFRDAGESPDGMVLLLGRMSNLDVYLSALRAEGLDCVVSGGSLFTSREEVGVIASLLDFLADPRDTENGLFSVLTSEMFGIDADDLAALATKVQEGNGALAKRRIDVGLADFGFAPGVRPSAKLEAARDVLRRAAERIGTWEVEEVLLGVCRESGWIARLEAGDAEARGRLANVLAAIRHVGELADEGELGLARTAVEFRHWLDVAKEGPASLSGATAGAVRVMTIHASKGLEFPIVAVAECWGGAKSRAAGLTIEDIGGVEHAALIPWDDAPKAEDLRGDAPELAAECVTRYEWASYLFNRGCSGDEAEAARLLYVALTRAREAVVLGCDLVEAKEWPGGGKLQKEVLASLFPGGMPEPGDTTFGYDYSYPVASASDGADDAEPAMRTTHHEALVSRVTVDMPEVPDAAGTAFVLDTSGLAPERDGAYACAADLLAADAEERASAGDDGSFALVDAAPEDTLASGARLVRPWLPRSDTFSYSSAHAARMAEGDSDSAPVGEAAPAPASKAIARVIGLPAVPAPGPSERKPAARRGKGGSWQVPFLSGEEQEDELETAPGAEDPDRATDLGSAFHALAQAMVETRADVSPEQVEAESRAWGLSASQRRRLDAALGRWRGSAIRAEALSHARVQAEVPFFCRVEGSELGSYAEGFIDLLATDPPSRRCLVVDYKTGDAGLTADELVARHEMQAGFYAGVLMGQGMEEVECAFVCVELEAEGGGPVVVRYSFDADHRPEAV